MGGLTTGVWKERERWGEIVTDGLSLDFVHRLHGHTDTHTYTHSYSHKHTLTASILALKKPVRESQMTKMASFLFVCRHSESLPAPGALLC